VGGTNGKDAALTRTDDWFKHVFTGEDHRRIWASTETNLDLSKCSSLPVLLLLFLSTSSLVFSNPT
jgi:hypothetical protein